MPVWASQAEVHHLHLGSVNLSPRIHHVTSVTHEKDTEIGGRGIPEFPPKVGQACGVKGFIPIPVIQGHLPPSMGVSVWEALFVYNLSQWIPLQPQPCAKPVGQGTTPTTCASSARNRLCATTSARWRRALAVSKLQRLGSGPSLEGILVCVVCCVLRNPSWLVLRAQ